MPLKSKPFVLLSVIVPTYNELENISVLIPRIAATLRKIPHEIVIADDNSPDGTFEKAREMAQKYPQVIPLRRTQNRGLAPAVIDGFQIAQGKYLAVMDADLQHDETVLPRFLAALEAGNDIVIGSRKVDGGGVEGWSYLRRFVSYGASLIARVFFKNLPSDPMSGFFAISAELFRRVAPAVNPKGFKILLEIVTQARGARMAEVGYTFRPRVSGESKLSGQVMIAYLLALFELKFGSRFLRRFTQFAIVGFSGLFINQLTVLIALSLFKFSELGALVLGIEMAIFSNFVFNNFFTFGDTPLRGVVPVLRGFVAFQIVCLLGAYLNLAVTQHLVHQVSLNLYVANSVGIVFASFWNFFLNVQFVWENR